MKAPHNREGSWTTLKSKSCSTRHWKPRSVGVQVYKTALRCAVNEDLQEEWQKYLDETENHVRIVSTVFDELGLDTEKETPGREVVRFKGQSLIKSMEMALAAGNPDAAQFVAAEAVVDAEIKDHCQLGTHRPCCREVVGEDGFGSPGGVRAGGRGRGPPPLSHPGLDP